MTKSAGKISIQKITREDLPEVAAMAGELVRWHHALDERRFLLVEEVEKGYERFFESQLEAPDTVLLIALDDGKRVGYAYARLEPRDWNALLDAFGALHDIFVAKEARRSGVASALLDEVAARLRALGAPRLVLSTAVQNKAAQKLFECHGFRTTMLEMTREL
jgi:ribosomal protein S18 acetylase RimI-like enzyme